MLPGERVRVIPVRQQQHLDIHTLCQQHVGTSHGCVDTCLVAIIEQRDILRKTPEQFDLME